MSLSDGYSQMRETKVDVCYSKGSVKDVATNVGMTGCIISILSLIQLLTQESYCSGNLIYFIFCLPLIYGARTDKRCFFWPFMIYNALLIIINIIAVNALIALYFVAQFGKYDQDDSPLWAMIAIAVILLLTIVFSIIFEHVIVTCYRALSRSEDVEFNPERWPKNMDGGVSSRSLLLWWHREGMTSLDAHLLLLVTGVSLFVAVSFEHVMVVCYNKKKSNNLPQ